MGKKKRIKEKRKSKQVDLSSLPLSVLGKNAALFLEREQYKKAIENYKVIILRSGKKGPALGELIQAYQGRVKELANKGMYREAIELYEHVVKVYDEEVEPSFYIELLFLLGDYQKAVNVFYTHQDKFKDAKNFQRIESTIALLLLAAKPGISALVPSGSPLLQHKHLIEEALKSLYLKQEEKAAEILQPIGLRSPYRDWKLLIKGLAAFYQRRDQEALNILNHIPKNSSIAGIIPFFKSIIEPTYPNSLMPGEEVSFYEKIMGNQAGVLYLSQSFIRASQMNNTKEMLKILRKCADFLPSDKDKEMLKQSSFNVLFHSSKTGIPVTNLIKFYSSLWDEPLTSFEESRISALIYEARHEIGQANRLWEDCLVEIKQSRAKRYFPTRNESNSAIAQILRRMAKNDRKNTDNSTNFFNILFDFNEDNESEFISYLIESLKYDPLDAETYEKIIAFYQQNEQDQQVSKWTEKFLKVFPDNIDTILSAATMAFQKKNFQKSLSLLDKALMYDPLNRKARELKISIHLSSAQKRMAQKKSILAGKDFKLASSLLTQTMRPGKVHIIWGVAEIALGDKEKGRILLQEGVQLAGEDVAAYFHIILEAASKRIPDNNDLIALHRKTLEEKLQIQPTPEKVKALVHLPAVIFEGNKETYPSIRKKMQIIGAYLEKAIHHCRLSEDDLADISHYLAIARLYPLLVQYAKEGIKRFKGNPRFYFFSLIGQMKGGANNNHFELQKKVDKIHTLCMEQGDYQTRDELLTYLENEHPLYSKSSSRENRRPKKNLYLNNFFGGKR